MKTYLEQFRAWWATLAERERRVVAAGGIALALILAYLAVWQPLGSAHKSREAALAAARANAVLIEQLAAEAQRGRPGSGATLGRGQSLITIVDASRRSAGIAQQPSLQPEGDATVRVQFEDVPFDGLLRWLNELQVRYGVRVDTADIERESGAGLVSARLTLMR